MRTKHCSDEEEETLIETLVVVHDGKWLPLADERREKEREREKSKREKEREEKRERAPLAVGQNQLGKTKGTSCSSDRCSCLFVLWLLSSIAACMHDKRLVVCSFSLKILFVDNFWKEEQAAVIKLCHSLSQLAAKKKSFSPHMLLLESHGSTKTAFSFSPSPWKKISKADNCRLFATRLYAY